ncbi:MAG: hypothetical protein R2932_40225 [Caldilineaceae bacterium]
MVEGKGKQRTDSTHVLAAVRSLNRYELLGETLRHALNIRRHCSSPVIAGAGICRVAQARDRRIEQAQLPKAKPHVRHGRLRSAPMA